MDMRLQGPGDGIDAALAKAQLDRQLREDDRWLVHTLRCVADAVIVADLDLTIRLLNPAAEAMTGWKCEEVSGLGLSDVLHLARPADAAVNLTPDLVASVIAEGRPAPPQLGLILRVRGGQEWVVDPSASPVCGDDGHASGVVLVLRDARERLRQEDELRGSEHRFCSAFDHARMGMALVSFEGHFLQVNPALCRLLNREREELMGSNQLALTHRSDRANEALRLQELTDQPTRVVQFQKRYLTGQGTDPLCSLVSVSLLNAGAACYLYQVDDLSEKPRAAEQVAALAEEKRRREAVELENDAKSQLILRISHELRTPLSSVIGLAELLQMSGGKLAPEKLSRYADNIHLAGQHLLQLVSDLTDLGQVATGQVRIELGPTSLGAAVQETCQLVQQLALDCGVAMEVVMDRSWMVLADARRLRQVLLNLASNAIKYNRRGGMVSFSAAARGADLIALQVKDTGIGMSPEQIKRLFQPFDRLGAETSAVQGSGLGLCISKGLVTEMGGSLVLTSDAHRGTSATVTLMAAG